MQKPSTKELQHLEDQAIVIANEIFNLVNQYTNDSSVAKFFLSDEIASSCYSLAASFTSTIYAPELEPEETIDSACLSFLYALMTYGVNIYLKERSFRTNAAPYAMPTDEKLIKRAQKKTLQQTAKGDLQSTPLADKIIYIILQNIEQQMNLEEFEIPKHIMNRTKLWDYTKLSLYWGYNFGYSLLHTTRKRPKKRSN